MSSYILVIRGAYTSTAVKAASGIPVASASAFIMLYASSALESESNNTTLSVSALPIILKPYTFESSDMVNVGV